jgi:hypothetical protein
VSLSSGDEVPQIFTRKSRLQPGEFLITSAKRLLQQYRHIASVSDVRSYVGFWGQSGSVANEPNSTLLTHICHPPINFAVVHKAVFAPPGVVGFSRLS